MAWRAHHRYQAIFLPGLHKAGPRYPAFWTTPVGMGLLSLPLKTRTMIRTTIWFFLILCLPGIAIAQDATDKMANKLCECIEQFNAEKLSTQEMQMKMSTCIIEGLGQLSDAEREALRVDVSDQQSMMDFAQRIGMRAANRCPEVMMQFAQSQGQGGAAVETRSVMEGTFQGLEAGEFAYLLIKAPGGQPQKLLWLRYFDGAEQLKDPASLKGKKVRVTFSTLSAYSPQLKDYIDRKEVRKLEVLD